MIRYRWSDIKGRTKPETRARIEAEGRRLSETWLYRNPEALTAVRQGLQEAAEGKASYVGSFAEYADEE